MSDVEALMERALVSPLGIQCQASDVEAFKRQFYSIRAKAREIGDTRFDILSCVTAPESPQTLIWLVRENTNGETKSGPGEGNGAAPHGTQGGTGFILPSPGTQQSNPGAGSGTPEILEGEKE